MLAGVVREAARRWRDGTAFVAPAGWPLTYAALDRWSDEVAAGLLHRGLAPGDVVALCLPPCPEHVVAFAAAAKAGLVTAGVNHRLTAGERRAVLARAAPALTVADPTTADGLDGGGTLVVEPSTDGTRVLVDLRTAPGGGTLPGDDPDRPVAIVFTSGTTGTPKGAVFCGRQLAFITQVDTGGRWGSGGPALSATSLAHLGPTTKLAGTLMRGGTTHLLDRWSTTAALTCIERQRMAAIGGIPTQVALLLAHPALDRHDLSCVRAVVLGGGPATPQLIREVRSRWGAAVAVRYSCTEAGIGVGTAFDDPPEDAEESVGRPHPGVEVSIRDEDGHPVAPGAVGEVCLRSPATMTGYWRDPAATATAFTDDGAVRTGDLGRVDERGRLQLVGRATERYVRGGYNVHPMEVEAALADDPRVAAVAVAPRPDPVMGEVGVAVVVPADPGAPPSLADLRSALAGRLATYKHPEDLVVADALPLTAMDKLDRGALRDLVAPRSGP